MRFLNTTTLMISFVAVLAAFFTSLMTTGTYRIQFRDYGKLKYLFAAMTVVALSLSLIGMIDISPTPYSGYEVTADYTVIHVQPNSPAELNGLKHGDRVIAIGEILCCS